MFYLCSVKKIAVILILALFLKPFFPVIDYVVNYEYISKVLCENKEKPAMHCNGKCHLMKELAKASETEKPISSDKKTIGTTLEDLFVKEAEVYNLVIFHPKTKSSLHAAYANLYAHLESHAIFHPPILVS